MQTRGVISFDLAMADHPMPDNGHIAVMGTASKRTFRDVSKVPIAAIEAEVTDFRFGRPQNIGITCGQGQACC